jgi:hypothetical protein
MRLPLLFLNTRKIWAIGPLLLATVPFATLLLLGCATGDFVKPSQSQGMGLDGYQERNGMGVP